MITPSELRTVIEDIKLVADRADELEDAVTVDEENDDQQQVENTFAPRDYDIDRLHADDARDKVFVAILKALVARHNKPSSPKELATCIMRHEFTILGGATPYATVSSRISQHFKRIMEHIPPRPPILGRVAHEKHTRKYFYYVASGVEQDEFLRNVEAGIIPTQSASGARRSKTAKKTRYSVPAIVAEPSISLSQSNLSAKRRTRRAVSNDDDIDNMYSQTPSSSSSSSSPSSSSGSSSKHASTTAAIHSTRSLNSIDSPTAASGQGIAASRSRRTSYDIGALWKTRGGGLSPTRTTDDDLDNDVNSDSSDGGSHNPYARKRYKSVRSAVSRIYSRRKSHSSDMVALSKPKDSIRNRSNSSSKVFQAQQKTRNPGAGKWRPSHTSDEEGSDVCSDSSGNDTHISDNCSTNHVVSVSVTDHNSDNGRLGDRAGSRRNRSSSAASCGSRYPGDVMLLPPVPHTTPRESASPDRTPYPPATSPTHTHQVSVDDDALDEASQRHCRTPDKRGTQNEEDLSLVPEIPTASPFLLPGGIASQSNSMFNVSPTGPARKSTLDNEDEPSPVMLVSGPDSEDTKDETAKAKTKDSTTTSTSSSTQSIADTTVTVGTPRDQDHKTEDKPKPVFSEQLIGSSEQAMDESDMNGGFGFNSFHDLMDAELMSVNELDKLWTTSNPTAEPYSGSVLFENIEATDSTEEASTRTLSDTTACVETDSLSSELTQKLLALSQDTKGTESEVRADGMVVADDTRVTSEGEMAESGAAAMVAEKMQASSGLNLDAPEDTKYLVENPIVERSSANAASSSKVILPDPFADIAQTAMVATKAVVSPRIVLTIVETVPVYMTVLTTTEPASECQGKWIVRRHRLLRLVENGYVNASSLLLAGGVVSEQERSIVLSLEVGRFKWRRPQSKLYGTWIPLPRARALAATCSLNHRLGPFLNDNLEAYFPAPLPTSFIRHLITPFFPDPASMLLSPPVLSAQGAGLGIDLQSLVGSATKEHAAQAISRSSTFGATARGAPSPSIIQTMNARSGQYSLVNAAKVIFGSDDRQLQSFLQLLSTESPMLGTALINDLAGSQSTTEKLEEKDEEIDVEKTEEIDKEKIVEETEKKAEKEVEEEPETKAEDEEPPEGPEKSSTVVSACDVKDGTASKEDEAASKKDEVPANDTKHPPCMKPEPTSPQATKDSEAGFDMALVMAGDESDVDMICCSTPPSPPPPPQSPPKQHAASDNSLAHQTGSSGLNARLAQTMEAFGFTGTAKANLLLRLRAAAAAKSTGRQQAVAPYLLYRNNSAKRASEDGDTSAARKRARVMRIARSKTQGTKGGRKASIVPDPTVVLRLASAIYNHTLNMATLAHQKQAAKPHAKPARPPAAAQGAVVVRPAGPRPHMPHTPNARPPRPPVARPPAASSPRPVAGRPLSRPPPPPQRPPIRGPLPMIRRPPMRPPTGGSPRAPMPNGSPRPLVGGPQGVRPSTPVRRPPVAGTVRPVQRPMQRPPVRGPMRPVQRPVQRPMQRPVQRPMQRPVQRPVQRPMQRPMQRPQGPAKAVQCTGTGSANANAQKVGANAQLARQQSSSTVVE